MTRTDKVQFDAFLLGKVYEIPWARIPSIGRLGSTAQQLSEQYRYFIVRKPHPSNAGECFEYLNRLIETVFRQRMRLGFKSLHHLPYQFLSHSYSEEYRTKFANSNGLTWFNQATGRIDVWITVEMVEPLLDINSNLTSGERLAVQFRVATVVVHEILHALWHASRRYHDFNNLAWHKDSRLEDFFEDEQVAEIGWSGDNAVSCKSNVTRNVLTVISAVRWSKFRFLRRS